MGVGCFLGSVMMPCSRRLLSFKAPFRYGAKLLDYRNHSVLEQTETVATSGVRGILRKPLEYHTLDGQSFRIPSTGKYTPIATNKRSLYTC